MMSRTRVGRHMDVQRMAAALRGPGIDTRCWVSLAVALGDSQVDKDHGVFVDVRLMPTEEDYTARVGSVYAGDSFGLYTRIREDDELAVVIPSGNAAEGVVVMSRLWSQADKPPTEDPASIAGNPEDFILVIEDGKNLRMKVTGGGQFVMDVGDNQFIVKEDKIELGADGAFDKAVLDSLNQTALKQIRDDLDALASTFNDHTHNVPDGITEVSGGSGAPAVGVKTDATASAPTNAAAIKAVPATNSELVTIDS